MKAGKLFRCESSLDHFWNIITNPGGSKSRREQGRARRMMFKPFIPLTVTGNVRSLANKMDRFGPLTRTQWAYQIYSMMSFTETWNSNASLHGFQTNTMVGYMKPNTKLDPSPA